MATKIKRNPAQDYQDENDQVYDPNENTAVAIPTNFDINAKADTTPFNSYFKQTPPDRFAYLKDVKPATIGPSKYGDRAGAWLQPLMTGAGQMVGQVGGAAVGGGLTANPLGAIGGGLVGGTAGNIVGSQGAMGIQHLLNKLYDYENNNKQTSYDPAKALGAIPEQAREGFKSSVLGEAIPVLGRKVGLPLLSGLSNIPREAIETLLKDPKRIEYLRNQPARELYESFGNRLGKEVDKGLSEREDIAKEFLNNSKNPIDIKDFNKNLNDMKGDFLTENGTPRTNTDAAIKNAIENQSNLNAQNYPEGKVLPTEANELLRAIKRDSGYNSNTGTIRPSNDPINTVLNRGGSDLRSKITEALGDDADAYNAVRGEQSALLGYTNNSKFTNRFDTDKAGSTMKSVLGEGDRGAYTSQGLGDVDKILGTKFLPEAKELGTTKIFANPDWLSGHSTGKSLLPFELGSAVSNKIIGTEGDRGLLGRLIGLAASPKAVYTLAPGVSQLGSRAPLSFGSSALLRYLNDPYQTPEEENK